MNQITIQVGTGSDIGDTTLVNNLKQYAIERYGWTEQIPDTENEGQFVDNPVTYIQAIFGDGTMQNFWTWLVDKKNAEKRLESSQEVEDLKSSVTLEVSEG